MGMPFGRDLPLGSARTAGMAALLTAGANLAAAWAMFFWLQPGLPLPQSTVEGRLAYMHGFTGRWCGGWLVWQGAAVTLVLLLLAMALRWRSTAPLRSGLALLCAGAGLAADTTADTLYMGLEPLLGPGELPLVETLCGLLTGYLGNGLYTVAGILLTWVGAQELPPSLVGLGGIVWAAGLALSGASLAHSVIGQFWATAVLMPGFVLWSLLLGWWLLGRPA